MPTNKWTREELIIAFNLYCKIPFGKIHNRNPEIIELAKILGRTPDYATEPVFGEEESRQASI
jgi:putative restriction endonuclease